MSLSQSLSVSLPGSRASPSLFRLSHAHTLAIKGSRSDGLARRQAGDPRAAWTPCSLPGAGSEVPGRSGGGRWAGDNPKRAGAGSFLRNSQRRIPGRGCPLPLTKYGAERPPRDSARGRGPHSRARHRTFSWSLPHPSNINLTWFSPPETPEPFPSAWRRAPVPRGSRLLPARGSGEKELEDPCQALSVAHSQSDSTNPPQVTSQVTAGALLIPPFHRRET